VPKSRKTLLREELQDLLYGGDARLIDMGAVLRVYRCSCGIAHAEWPEGKDHSAHGPEPAELVLGKDGQPRIWGGLYDPLLRKYVGPSEHPIELKCHEGQVQLLTLDGNDAYGRPLDSDDVLSVLGLGGPGAGKTYAIVLAAVLDALDRPNSAGAMVAPISQGRDVLYETWDELCLPADWVKPIKRSKSMIVLANNTKVHVRAAKAQTLNVGSPLRSLNLDWADCDESQSYEAGSRKEIAARGRRAGKKYRIREVATNGRNPVFKVELASIKTSKQKRLVRFSGWTNPFVTPEWWQKLRSGMSDREWKEIFEAQEVSQERRVYGRFELDKNICPAGKLPLWLDDVTRRKWGDLTECTAELLHQHYHANLGWKFILATDFGVLINTSILLRAYRTRTNEILWWACDELTTAGQTDMHAHNLVQHYSQDECVVIADPHLNSKAADKSDYEKIKDGGFTIYPAAYGTVTRKSRIGMLNALLCNAQGVRRLFIDCDSGGNHKCPRLVQSLLTSEVNELGLPETERKNGWNDPSHWPSATAWGLYPFEKHVGQLPAPNTAPTTTTSGTSTAEPWWNK
jgi:hypothetical protein